MDEPLLGSGPPYTVALGAEGNPDHDEPRDIGLPVRRVEVPSLHDAVETARRFIVENNLGGGNWGGPAGKVRDSAGKVVARMSYNGRLWKPGRSWPQPEIVLGPGAAAASEGGVEGADVATWNLIDRANGRIRADVAAEHGRESWAYRMVQIHMDKPWIDGFRAVLVRPLRDGLEDYLGPVAGTWDGDAWYVPSAVFWSAHAETSHPPDGKGCDAAAHSKFLAADAKDPEFGYAALLNDGTLMIEEKDDFGRECAWWKENT